MYVQDTTVNVPESSGNFKADGPVLLQSIIF
jgi:hypothetical protein